MAKPEVIKTGKQGRPKIVIDYETVEKLAGIMCTQQEIADFLEIGIRTLQTNEEAMKRIKRGMTLGKSSLRRVQFKSAMDGNVTMQIWLGKQHLGQREKHEEEKEKIQKVVIVDDIQ